MDACSCSSPLPSNSAPILMDGQTPAALPNALENWPEILATLGSRPVAICLDYDGTLSKHVPDPDKAYMDDDMKSAVRRLAARFPVSIVTGRPIDKIREFLTGMGTFYFAANHGLYITLGDDADDPFIVAEPCIPHLESAYRTLKQALGRIPGCIVENNYLSVSVHYRNVHNDEKERIIEQVVTDVCDDHKAFIRKTDGAKVWELRPNIDWNKGKALEYILEKKFPDPDTIVFYIGDDTTDEDAFKVVRRLGGVSVLVNHPKPTDAQYIVSSTTDVFEILTRLADFAVRHDSG